MSRLSLAAANVVEHAIALVASDRAIKDPGDYLSPGATDLNPYLQAVIAECKIPGMVAAVLEGDRIIARGVVGVRKAGGRTPIRFGDRFHLGSCTKSMTATLIGTLVDQGKLKWSATVGELVGKDFPEMHPAWRDVTLQLILEHRSGLPANYSTRLQERHRASRRPLPEQRREILAEALSRAPRYAPGRKMVYSNVGFIFVGVVLEKITGRAWEELMRARLFRPLRLATGGFGPPNTRGKVDAPWGHDLEGTPQQSDLPAAMGPAGTVHLAIGDWAKYVALHLRGDPRNPRRKTKLLRPATFERLHTPGRGGNYIAGWRCDRHPAFKGSRRGDSGKIIWHNGTNLRWYAVMVLAPELDRAVLIAANRFRPLILKSVNLASRALLRHYRR